MEIFAWGFSFGGFRLNTFVRELSLGNFCLGTLAWEFSFGSFNLVVFVWELSFGASRLGSEAGEIIFLGGGGESAGWGQGDSGWPQAFH